MLSFYQKRKLKSFLYSKAMLAVLLLLCIPLGMSVYERYQVEREMAERQNEVEKEKERLLERKQALEEKVQYLEDERGIESEIRRHFDVAKEGEQVVIIVDERESSLEPEVETVKEDESKKWYLFWQ